MPALGSVNFSILRGIESPLRLRVDVWEVPGLDGYGAQTLGQGDSEFDLVGVGYWPTSSDADDHIDACAALQGTVVIFIDDWADETDNVLIERMEAPAKRPMIYQGNAAAVRTEIRFHCRRTQ